MTLNFNWVTPMSTGKNGAIGDNVIYARKTNAGRREGGETRHQLRLTIPKEAMKAARFVIGDRVEVGFAKDEDGLLVVAVRRVISGGYAISSASTSQGNMKGQLARGSVQMTFRDGMPDSFTSSNGGYSVTETGMLIAKEES